MRSSAGRIRAVIAASAFLLSIASAAAAGPIVISQVYGGGGNSGAAFTNDFIELFNPTSAPVLLIGWSVQYASTTGSTWQGTSLAGTLQPGQYLLIQEHQGSGGTTPLVADVMGAIDMSATAGKVALVSSVALLTGACPSGMLDFVGYGPGTDCFEGSGPTAAPSNTTALLRASAGCADTDNNAADFATGAPSPRNLSSTVQSCRVVTPPDEPGPGSAVPSPATLLLLSSGLAGYTVFALRRNTKR